MHERLILSNGVRIVYEHMPFVRTAAVGISVGVGSRDEKRSQGGFAHYIEHMLFKGTENYSAAELAGAMDSVGGQYNAYTTRENTAFYARVLDEHLDTAIDLLREMFFLSNFDEGDVENERGVICEEIDMYDDTPEDVAVERLVAGCFPGALGRPVLGTPATLRRATGEALRGFMAEHYRAGRIVVALCGSFEDRHLRRLEEIFSAMPRTRAKKHTKAEYTPCLRLRKKATEQNHLCIGFPGIPAGSGDRFAANLLNTILGGGMSSRLFQTVREQHGLCYSISSFSCGFADTGFLGIETAVGRETEEKAICLILDEARRILDGGVTEAELSRAREQAKSSLVMALERTTTRMEMLSNAELTLGYIPDTEELIARYMALTREDIRVIAEKLLRFDRMSFSAVGRVDSPEHYRELLGF